MKDIAMVARAFGTSPGATAWNPCADINCDGTVNMKDIAIVCRAFAQTKGFPSQTIMFTGANCGNEYETATLLYNLAQFLDNTSDTRASSIINSVQFYIVPIVDIDKFGLSYQEGGTGNRTDSNQVCINRNFAYGWNDFNWGQNNSAPTGTYFYDYRGNSSESENETQECQQVFNIAHLGVFNDIHLGGANAGSNPNGTFFTMASPPTETQKDIDNEANIWSNYTAVTSTDGITNEYTTYGPVIYNGTAGTDALYSHIPSVTLDVWDYGNWSDPNFQHHPNADNLNGTMLQEIECLSEGEKNFLTNQTATKMQIQPRQPKPLVTTTMMINPSQINTTQNATFSFTVQIVAVSNLSGWSFELDWNSTLLSCINATIYNCTSWNSSLPCSTDIDNTNGVYNAGNTQGLYDTSNDTFTGTTAIAKFYFQVLGNGTSTTLSLSNVDLFDWNINDIATSTASSTVNIA
jgi:hypothetical protein